MHSSVRLESARMWWGSSPGFPSERRDSCIMLSDPRTYWHRGRRRLENPARAFVDQPLVNPDVVPCHAHGIEAFLKSSTTNQAIQGLDFADGFNRFGDRFHDKPGLSVLQDFRHRTVAPCDDGRTASQRNGSVPEILENGKTGF